MSAIAIAVRERPILFSGEMVSAILDGRKTQTRRVLRPIDLQRLPDNTAFLDTFVAAHCPYGQPGDRLWVRENWTADFGETFSDMRGAWWHQVPRSLRTQRAVVMLYYAADESVYHAPTIEQQYQDVPVEARRSTWVPSELDLEDRRWVPSIHMPRWASRLTLEITDVRVERVQDISTDDVGAEGVEPCDDCDPFILYHQEGRAHWWIEDYRTLWDSLNAKRGYGWDANPWVWVLSFRRVES